MYYILVIQPTDAGVQKEPLCLQFDTCLAQFPLILSLLAMLVDIFTNKLLLFSL